MRIFFGATIPEETKNEINDIQWKLRPILPGARFESRDKLHITLLFIGDFDDERVEELYASSVEKVKEGILEPSPVEIYGTDYFPNENTRRGIWLDCRDNGTLAAVAQSLSENSRMFGVIPEARAFRAHITIARSRGRDSRGMKHIDLQKVWDESKLSTKQFNPKSVALFQSKLSPSGSEYEVIHEFSLQQ